MKKVTFNENKNKIIIIPKDQLYITSSEILDKERFKDRIKKFEIIFIKCYKKNI